MTQSDGKAGLAGDWLGLAHPDRCRVCALPLPANAENDGICSRRCAGLRRESEAVQREVEALTARILAGVASLKAGTTICPRALSQEVRPGLDQPLTLLRPLIFNLAAAGKLRLRQNGSVVLWWKIRGPFRVGV